MNIIEQIKLKINAKEYAQNYLGFEIQNNRSKSLDPGSNKTCLQFFDDGCFYDYKTGASGDVIDLCAQYNYNGNKSEAVKDLAKKLSLTYKANAKWKKYIDWQMHNILTWHKNLKPSHKEYILSRGIKEKTIKELKIGSNDSGIVLPYQKNGYCPYYITRGYPNKSFKKQKRDTLNEHVPWGLHTINKENEILHITEGMFDAITMDQEGLSVLSPITGHFTSEQIKLVLKKASLFKKTIIAFDGDNAGTAFTKKIVKILFENNIEFDCVILPDGIDVNEYYQKHKNIDFDLSDGIEYLANSFENIKEFEYFIMNNYRFKSEAVMKNLISKSKHDVKLYKPTPYFLANEVIKKYKIRFSGGGIFYFYKDNIWNQCDSNKIREFIVKELGRFASGSLISSVEAVIKGKTMHPIRYNSKEIWGFKNGVLELESGIFRKHRENDNLTFVSQFDYDKAAKCPTWERFIEETMDYDPRKMCLLQEYAGYIFFPDNKEHQVCLILLGERSANGKSTFIDAIQNLVTPETNDLVSTLEITEFDDQFRRIELKNSIINVSSEVSPGKGDGETYFKKVMDGSIINGCRKGTQSINFISRSKSIFACNEMPNFRETNDAASRRIMFVKFDMQFVDYPEQEFQKKIDKRIGKKLEKEISGIFNWAYSGYQLLKGTKKFTETEEQKEMKKDLKMTTNNTFIFFEEEFLNYKDLYITRRDLYNRYKVWCDDSGHRPCSRTKFIRLINSKVENIENVTNDTVNRRYDFL